MRSAVLLAVALASCGPPPCPPDAPPPPAGATTCPTVAPPHAPPGGDACARACARAEQLGCEVAKPTPRGATCLQVCEAAAAEGVDLTCGGAAGDAASCEACP